MVKRTTKEPRPRMTASQEIRSALRAFILAHREGWSDESLKDLKIYLQAYHSYRGSTKAIEALIMEEMKGIGVEMKAKHLEEELFSTNKSGKGILLGSCFCPRCGRFKNFKKECPHPNCGYHEMTV
jgi:hypothetical protein